MKTIDVTVIIDSMTGEMMKDENDSVCFWPKDEENQRNMRQVLLNANEYGKTSKYYAKNTKMKASV